MVTLYHPLSDLPVSKQKPLVLAIRTLIASGFVLGTGVTPANAELPVPTAAVTLTPTPVDIAVQGHATAAIAGQAMTIKQITDKATLDWKSFNIDKGYSVNFDQPSATSVALNNIHQADASKILGSLTANGQVYLINQNGFLFGKDSQVNVNSLVATTLGITDAVFQNGITKAFSADQSAALEGNGQIYIKDNSGNFVLDQQGQKVKIQIFVDAGASIKTNAPGGRVILAAPSITNAGSIETPDGQTILAAAKDKVYLQEANGDPNIRGLLVEVGTGGDVNNVGKVLADRGNASLIGFAVNQNGIASASTSVQLNGSVRLLAREGFQQIEGVLQGGTTTRTAARATELDDNLGTSATVTLAGGSVTSVNLDTNKSATAIDAQAQQRSFIEISGHDVQLRNNSLVQAHSGNVNITAVDNLGNPAQKGNARIYQESGSTIDVSGVKNVALAATSNVVNVELRKNELRDAPLQRDGVLYGQKVNVDIRDANLVYDANGNLVSASLPIADLTGAVARIARNIDERSTSGGTVKLTSSGDVITQAGSTIDFSGGSVAYQAGQIETTKLIANGQVYDISTADPNRHYNSILAKSTLHYVPGYLQGKAGGTLSISSYEAILDGKFQGQTVSGPLQRLAADLPLLNGLLRRRATDLPLGSTLFIDLNNGNNLGKQNVVFDQNPLDLPLNSVDPLPRNTNGSPDPVALTLNTTNLNNSGIQNITVKTNGDLSVTKNTRVALPAFGKLDLSAQNFDIQGAIVSPSGTVNLKPVTQRQGDKDVSLPGSITLGSSALIDVSGLWVNDWLAILKGSSLATIATQGGNVNLLTEQGDIHLAKGSVIEADGGAWRQNNGKVTAGVGGNIKLTAASNDLIVHTGSVILDGDLHALSLTKNGALTVQTNEVVIGSVNDIPTRNSSDLQALLLTPEFFQKGGFSSYDLTANYYGLKVADNVKLNLQQRNLQLNASALTAANGSKIKDFSQQLTLSDALRTPVNLKLSYAELTGQNWHESLHIGTGALIQADANASVVLNSDTSIIVDGSIKTPGGSIALNITQPKIDSGFSSSQEIWLGADSQLVAQGAFIPQLNLTGLVTGQVLNGGTVALNANRGYIVTRQGSKIDVSGISRTLSFIEGQRLVSRNIASDAGSISLAAGEGILADGDFIAHSGGAGAADGTLTVNLDRGLRSAGANTGFPDQLGLGLTRIIQITTDNSQVVPENLKSGDAIDSAKYSGLAKLKSSKIYYVDLDKSKNSNNVRFDTITLTTDAAPTNSQFTSAIEFQGNVTLNAGRQIILDTPTIKANNATVTLATNYAALGSTKVRNNSGGLPLAPAAIAGSSQFNLNANGIDLIGGLSYNGFDTINLQSAGDVRLLGLADINGAKDFLGQLNIAGDLNITSSQLYPATLSDYTINADKTVSFIGNGGVQSPVYSAGGRLTVNAPDIFQKGVLKAPFGELVLNAGQNLQLATGSLTSVSGNGLVIPFGLGSGGTTWLYPLNSSGNFNILVNTPPEKRLQLSGRNLDLQTGATIDLSGGGDLYAYEFITGAGGSNDTLASTVAGNSQKFTVLPGYNNVLTPYDPLESATSGLANGQSVYLNAGAGLAAGWYTLLPAHYALLPGAYLVTPKAGTQDQYQTTTNLGGTVIVSGQYGVAGTNIKNPRTQGFAVEPGSIARTRSQYTDYSANQFFSAKATKDGTVLPQLPWDAGSLVLDAKNSLALSANLLSNPFGKGLGGQVDISADRLELVGQRQDLAQVASGTVGLLVDDLNKLNSPSLLLGGKRSKDAKGQRITVTSGEVKVDGNVDLKGQEILLAAFNNVTIASGAVVESSGKTGATGGALLVDNINSTSDAALLRVSNAGQVDVIRNKTISGIGGVLTVESGARLKAGSSMLLDSSKDTVFDGTLDMQGGALALNSSAISIGNAPVNTTGLVLRDTNFTVDELRLTSASDLNIYGAVAFNNKQLLISAASINGFNNANNAATISADVINLSNKNATGAEVGSGSGELTLNAREIQLGSGNYAINGFQKINLNATEGINGVGQIIDPVSGNSSIAAPGLLNVAGNINLNAGYISGSNGSTTSIEATGHTVTLTSTTVAASNHNVGLGVRWSIIGDAITSGTLSKDNINVAQEIYKQGAHFDLPSGILELKALNGTIELNNGTQIDLSGRAITFADTYKASAAGSLSLIADNGSVNLAAETQLDKIILYPLITHPTGLDLASKLDPTKILLPAATINLAGATVNGHQVSNAGLLTVKAGKGQFNWGGVIDTKGNATSSSDLRQGRFQLDVNSFETGGFTALNNKLITAGFSEEQTLEQRSGDVTIASGDNIKAHQFQLIADQGAVSIAGTIDASGSKAGSVSVYGRNAITLTSTGKITATATSSGNTGGSVTLDTVHQDDTGSGLLNLSAADSLIDVSGGTGGSGGSVHLRTGRDIANNVNVSAINNKIQGADPLRTALEATRVYDNQSSITTAKINTWNSDTATFMAHKPVLTNTSGTVINILPGIEVRSNGDLTLTNKWDFMDGSWSTLTSTWNSTWRYADSSGFKSLPGFLTLRAAGDLNINASLTDALATTPIIGQSATLRSQDMIQPGQSWSYNLIAGGNVKLADSYNGPNPLAAGNVKQQLVVRTGTGEIDIKAGKNIVLNKDVTNTNTSNNAAAIYTAGTTAIYNRTQLLAGTIPGIPGQQPGETLDAYLGSLAPEQLNQLLRYGLLDEKLIGGSAPKNNYLFAEYPLHGGDIKLAASGNIQGAQTGQQISDWLVRDNTKQPTAWGINISGDQTGTARVSGNTIYNKGTRNFNQNIGALGGGNVSVEAGGYIKDLTVMIPTTGKPLGVMNEPNVWTANGTAINGGGDLQITAGKDILGGEFYTGFGAGRLVAGDNIAQSAVNPNTNIGVILDVGNASFDMQARLDVNLATALNPTLLKQTKLPVKGSVSDTRFVTYGAESGVNLQSIAGNVIFQNDYNAISTLKNIKFDPNDSGFQYTLYPGILKAAALSGDVSVSGSMKLYPSADGQLQLLANRNLISDSGSLFMSDADPAKFPSIAIPASTLEGDGLFAYNYLNPLQSDTSLIHAAIPLHKNDANKPLIMAKLGNIGSSSSAIFFNLPQAANYIAGGDIRNLDITGQNISANDTTLIKAGGSISYDTLIDGNGVVSANDTKIQLAGPGQLDVIAGKNVNLGSSAGILTVGNVLNSLLANQGASINVLTGLSDKIDYSVFIDKYKVVGSYSAQLQGFDKLSAEEQSKHLDVLLKILFEEIKQSALAAAIAPQNHREEAYKRGFDAINTLFPGEHYAGDLGLVFSQLKTLAGGDINLAVPGGKLDVGLAGKLAGLSKTADQLGIVVQQKGDLNVLAQGDINVNQSRVFTLGGGNITAWSSKGSIDAGKGAKSAISAPAPVTSVDSKGNVITVFPPIISGSGIQAIGNGTVTLAAPVGVVDAGEAGISGGQIVIAATAVIGASNIQSSGGTVGVPATVSAPVGLSGGDSAATSASKTATQSSSDNNSNSSDNAKDKQKSTVSILSADVVGFGDCSVSDVKDATTKCGGG